MALIDYATSFSKTRTIRFIGIIAFATLLGLYGSCLAGTTTIEVRTETGGDIDTDGDGTPENVNGALYWDGLNWTCNDTYGHMYFWDKINNEKIDHPFLSSEIHYSGGGNNVLVATIVTPGNNALTYGVFHDEHIYEKDYRGIPYRFTTAKFTLSPVDPVTLEPYGLATVMVSRSADASRITPYFDLYIENGNGVTPDGSWEAFRSDPVWYHYTMGLEEAINQTDPDGNRRGDLVSVNNQYWLDFNGGSEMGGWSRKLITGPSIDTQLNGLGSSFITSAAVQYQGSDDYIREIVVYPHVYSIEALTASIPTLNEWGMILAALLLVAAAFIHIRRRRA